MLEIKIIKFFVNLYHGVFPSRFGTCRYNPTCSQYLIDSVSKYGLLKGTYRGLMRLLTCHPLSKKPIYDPA